MSGEKSIRAKLVSLGIDPEKFDIHAHTDRTLSRSENMANMAAMHGISLVPKAPIKTTKTQRRQARLGTFYQIGKSDPVEDRRRVAKAPGQRKSKSGKRYTERRKNRSDRPGRMI